LFGTIAIVETISPDPIPTMGFMNIEPQALVENPSRYEETRISIFVTISQKYNHSDDFYQLADTIEGVTVYYNLSLGNLCPDETVLIRGVSLLVSRGFVIISEFQIQDNYNSLIRSIPGLIIIAALLVVVFTFDFREIAFVPRRT
jgi:hypothetical protein